MCEKEKEKVYTKKASQKAIIRNSIFQGVIVRLTVPIGMICEFIIQILEQLKMKFSYVSTARGDTA